MTEEEVRKEIIKKCSERGGQSDIATALAVGKSTVGRWLTGGDITPSHMKLLELYLFGKIPFEDVRPAIDLGSELKLSGETWQVISILSTRNGVTPSEWIGQRIRDYLGFLETQTQMPKNITQMPETPEHSGFKDIRFVGSMAAGQPVEAPLDDILTVRTNLSHENHVIYEVNGESAGDAYPDGSRWLVEVFQDTRTARKHTPAVFRDSQGCYLKIWDGKRFKSVDPSHPDVQPDEALELVGYPVEMVQD